MIAFVKLLFVPPTQTCFKHHVSINPVIIRQVSVTTLMISGASKTKWTKSPQQRQWCYHLLLKSNWAPDASAFLRNISHTKKKQSQPIFQHQWRRQCNCELKRISTWDTSVPHSKTFGNKATTHTQQEFKTVERKKKKLKSVSKQSGTHLLLHLIMKQDFFL